MKNISTTAKPNGLKTTFLMAGLIFVAFLCLSFPASVARSQEPMPCQSYIDFLDGVDFEYSGLSECDELSDFLIKSRDLNIVELLHDYQAFTKPDGVIGGLVNVVLAYIKRMGRGVFEATEAVQTEVAILFFSRNDLPRSEFYTYLLRDQKFRYLKNNLKEGSYILDEIKTVPPSEILGDEFEFLDGARKDFLLSCLMRTDNFQMKLSRVLKSKVYSDCLKP